MSELEAVTLTYYGHCPFKLQGWGSWWRLSGSGSDPPEQKPNTDPSLKKMWVRNPVCNQRACSLWKVESGVHGVRCTELRKGGI